MQPKYPIYIISKGRADSRLTVKTLDDMGAMYRVVIEQSEYDDYAAVINPNRLLVLPENFREDPRWARRCEATGLLGGSIPVRCSNFTTSDMSLWNIYSNCYSHSLLLALVKSCNKVVTRL